MTGITARFNEIIHNWEVAEITATFNVIILTLYYYRLNLPLHCIFFLFYSIHYFSKWIVDVRTSVHPSCCTSVHPSCRPFVHAIRPSLRSNPELLCDLHFFFVYPKRQWTSCRDVPTGERNVVHDADASMDEWTAGDVRTLQTTQTSRRTV